jgi:hypothetical protein
MLVEPLVIPVTIPVADPTEAISALPLVQIPPEIGWLRLAVSPRQTVDGPVIAGPTELTTTGIVTKQPAGDV